MWKLLGCDVRPAIDRSACARSLCRSFRQALPVGAGGYTGNDGAKNLNRYLPDGDEDGEPPKKR